MLAVEHQERNQHMTIHSYSGKIFFVNSYINFQLISGKSECRLLE